MPKYSWQFKLLREHGVRTCVGSDEVNEVDYVTNRKRFALHAEVLGGKRKVDEADHIENPLRDRLCKARL